MSNSWPAKNIFIDKTVNGETKKDLSFLGHVALTGSLITLVLLSHIAIYTTANFWQKDWLSCNIDNSRPFFKEPATLEQTRLNQQLASIQDLTSKNCKITAFFYKQYFICLSIGGTSALVTLLCIIFLSKEGWEKSHNALINLSVTAFSVTTLYLNITQIFQQDKNLKTSQDLYASYSALRNSFSSSLALAIPTSIKTPTSQKGIDPSKKITYSDLIQDTDNKLNALGYIRLGFDPTPITEMQNGANSIFRGSNSLNVTSKPTASPTPQTTPSK